MTADTIAAIATPPGNGGVGIVRVSGPNTTLITQSLLGKLLSPRLAHYCEFKRSDNTVIDMGLALFFPGPNSFTGEDVLELQGHGGPVVMDCLLKRVLELGARAARPGEFSERAFLNDKIDLAQAEAIADLIHAESEQAARSAINSLQGAFSKQIEGLLEQLIKLRMYVEAAIDFPEEEIDFLNDDQITTGIQDILAQLDKVFAQAQQGALLQEGINVVIVGKPNAGKSSLLNYLSGRDTAIVTDIPGTTRDVLRERIHIDGMPLHIIDTAGLRDNPDQVEQIGIERAWAEIEKADRVLLLLDSSTKDIDSFSNDWSDLLGRLQDKQQLTVVLNKVDVSNQATGLTAFAEYNAIGLSAKTGEGVKDLLQHLKQSVGYAGQADSSFIARRRHLSALTKTREHVELGYQQLQQLKAGELLAEELRLAQNALSEITGRFSSDDLLGEIFSSFCIGK